MILAYTTKVMHLEANWCLAQKSTLLTLLRLNFSNGSLSYFMYLLLEIFFKQLTIDIV